METILILAQALSKSSKTDITRLDIHYNELTDCYTGYVWFEMGGSAQFAICENGEISKVNE